MTAQSPFWFFVLITLIGVVGSVATLAWILVIFFRELKSKTLW